jgi:hypothetical protein
MYSIDARLDYLVNDWIPDEQELGLQLDPDFQRGHVWNHSQQVAYIEYLLKGGTSGKELYFNNTLRESTFCEGSYVCVDGLQRITAIQLFVTNKIKVFGCLLNEFEGLIKTDLPRMTININDLGTRKQVLTWYLQMNTGGTVHADEEIARVKALLGEC